MSSDEERRKREIFESMSPRRQQRILKKGYDKWNPFLPPKEPPFFRKGAEVRDGLEVERRLERFLRDRGLGDAGSAPPSPEFVAGAREICFGLAEGRDRYLGMEAFCLWWRRVRGEEGE